MPNTAASHLVLAPYSEKATVEAARHTLQAVGGHVSCAYVFASADYRPYLPDFLEIIQLHGHVPLLMGCSGSGLVGAGVEAEQASGFSLLFMDLPHTRLHPLVLSPEQVEAAEGGPAEQWHRTTGLRPEDVDAWTVLADPGNFPIEPLLAQWNTAYPGIPCVGGLSSGGREGSDIFLYQNRKLVEGALMLGFKGGLRIETLVSQGCRPVGEPFTITGADRNFVTSLGSRPAYEILQETFEQLPPEDQELAQGNLFAGLATSEYVDEFKTGDFLIRNLLGADPKQGVLALGAFPRTGQTLQFQLRDRRSADAELRQLAADHVAKGTKPFASLLFPCIGRGEQLFGKPHHDAQELQTMFGAHAGAGFFCNGEIGPVGGKTFIHGYTASVALFTDAPGV